MCDISVLDIWYTYNLVNYRIRLGKLQWQIQDYWRGEADLTEPYQNNLRQNRLSESFVPFLNFKLKWPQRGGWLATQSTPLDPLVRLPLQVDRWSTGFLTHRSNEYGISQLLNFKIYLPWNYQYTRWEFGQSMNLHTTKDCKLAKSTKVAKVCFHATNHHKHEIVYFSLVANYFSYYHLPFAYFVCQRSVPY